MMTAPIHCVRSRQSTAAILLAISVLFLGVNWPVLKIAIHSIEPIWFTTIRMLSAGIIFALILAVRGRLVIPARAPMLCRRGRYPPPPSPSRGEGKKESLPPLRVLGLLKLHWSFSGRPTQVRMGGTGSSV